MNCQSNSRHQHLYINIYIHIQRSCVAFQMSCTFSLFCQATQLSLSLRQSLSHPGPLGSQWPQFQIRIGVSGPRHQLDQYEESFERESGNPKGNQRGVRSTKKTSQDNGEAKVIVDFSIQSYTSPHNSSKLQTLSPKQSHGRTAPKK